MINLITDQCSWPSWTRKNWLEARQEIQARLYWGPCCSQGEWKHKTDSLDCLLACLLAGWGGGELVPCIERVGVCSSFPCSSAGKVFACNAGDLSSIPGSGRPPGEGIGYPFQYSWACLAAQKPPAMWETWVWAPGWEDPLEEGLATL